MSLFETILNGNTKAMVPESTYDKYLKPTFDKLYKPEYTTTEFDPIKHLRFYSEGPIEQHKYNNTRRLTMEELGLTNPKQISHIGVSDPFPLFTDEAIDIMKQEVLSKDTFMKYGRYSHSSGKGTDCTIRGYAKVNNETVTPFTYAAWTHPRTVELVSTMAGIELEVVMDYEIAHVNVSMKEEDQVEEDLKNYDQTTRDITKDCVVGWHCDSYPFVCVLMLSDTTNMIGGETSLRMGKGTGQDSIAVVPGPTKGYAAVLQGRLIEHIAPNPIGTSERITMVTSYRAKDKKKPDGSVLSTVKPEVNFGSRYNDFYPEWVQYRSDLIIDNLQQLTRDMKKDGIFQKEQVIAELKILEEYLVKTYQEMEVSDEEWSRINESYKKIE
ncbi:hypothetical protein PSN45_004704 [Yamadazyma tenuis]|uniref:Fe2OG dioxygenase domain-containing protein n=1 Tax=Candida tenuis (strain ATCC 10573 / BCRC 21748 / CBS 615 / JCM 9827 / NBRC 10315 / NRRL Y-1498 / VKM Y-70) TaxID=590646 RepID=G3B6V1_CANTC|nr:uncharacterized protein CANTEDRAFT_122709 [Yamadazyma tenuis ATCC 10573]EGV63029.1 hypothetical protein CANTEDRAFT_122709 [Yamadazyma tenuis ATCC 10573]WEJ97156.1 hypothetical protein PSN45_004704 [Yamadazyma tenuis]